MSIDCEPRIILGTDMEKLTIDEEKIEVLLNDGYVQHGSCYSGQFNFIGKEVSVEEIIDPNFMLKYSSLKKRSSKRVGRYT
ncbi:hypothetical protein [Proteus mirabilis]|uniref:hypothetical protein n=1 Tax=Proteus mirabilis TaxID=584 RepID=UPI0034E56DE5